MKNNNSNFDVIDLDAEEEVASTTFEQAKQSLTKLSVGELQKLQTELIDQLASEEGKTPKWTRDLLEHVQTKLLQSKMRKLGAVKSPLKEARGLLAEAPAAVEVLHAQVTRGGAAKTLVNFKKITGEFPEELLADPRVDFAIKAPLNQIASRKSACIFSLHAGEAGEGLTLHVDYFKSRQRAGLAKLASGVEVALIPPGPLSRNLLGPDLLAADPLLSQLALGLILQKYPQLEPAILHKFQNLKS